MDYRMWVVGGDTGIGACVAQMAASSGVFKEVLCTGKDLVNVQNASSIDRFIHEAGPFSHTVFSAGIASLQMIGDLDMTAVMEVYDINVFGFMRLMRSLGNHQVGGRVCAVVSDAGKVPMRGSMAYCSSKAALAMAIRVAAREMAPNWSINGVSPCVVEDTRMTDWIDATVPSFRGWTPEQARAYEQSSIPMGRRAMKFEVAAVILSTLLGPDFLTGSIIDLTGGK